MSSAKKNQTSQKKLKKTSASGDEALSSRQQPGSQMAYDQMSAPHDLAKYRGKEEFSKFGIYERPEEAEREKDAKFSAEASPQGPSQQAPGPSSKSETFSSDDDDIMLDQINERLTWSSQVESGGIRVKVAQGVVTLQGQVDSSEDRQLAENLVGAIDGIRQVINKLEVQQAS